MNFYFEKRTRDGNLSTKLISNTDGTNSGKTSVISGCLDCKEESGKENSFADQVTWVVIVVGALLAAFYAIGIIGCMCHVYITRDKDPRSFYLADQTGWNVMGVNSSPERKNRPKKDEEENSVQLPIVAKNNMGQEICEDVEVEDKNLAAEDMC